MKFELTDSELQIYNSKVQAWLDGLHDYIRDNFASELKVAYERCIESVNDKLLKVQFVGCRDLDDAPAFAEKYGKSNCIMNLMKAYKEMHPFPKLVEL